MISFIFKKRYYNIEVVLKLAYKDRYLLDKKKYYERYFLSLCISLLSEEPNFMIKSFVLFLNFEFYYKLSSLKLLTTTNIKSNNYIMDKSLRFDYYKRFIVSDFTYNSSVNYSIYFKNNQVFYLDIVVNILKQKLNRMWIIDVIDKFVQKQMHLKKWKLLEI